MAEIEYIEIDSVSRLILSPEGMLLGVMEDADVERKYFKCQKIVGDNVDLSQCQIYMKYTQAVTNNPEKFKEKEPGIYYVDDVNDEGDYITFSWKLSGNVFAEPGFVAFSMLATDGESPKWNTYPSIGTVLITIPGGLEEVQERYPDIITQLLNRMDEIASASSSGISAADATEGQVPTADGKGGWSWENQNGGSAGGDGGTISNYYDAQLYGVDPSNTGAANTQALQSLIDTAASAGGGTIFIGPGEYEFAISNTEAFDEHCIKLRSNVSIIGAGNTTILLPTGSNTDGFDMFYFNDLKDGAGANYLENCVFRDFVVDGKSQSCTNYTTRGKAFMVNLFHNCYWQRVTVRNTDATGFGMDCPINCSITDCVAESCGKAATTSSEGASGFGIGFGYSNDETITISGCTATDNKKFGIFFEHQKRFDGTTYIASRNRGMFVDNCTAMENYYNFGALHGNRAMFRDCNSIAARKHGYYLGNCEDCSFCGCYSNSEGVAITSGSDNSAAAGYVIASDASASGSQQTKDNAVMNCVSKYNYYGCKVHGGSSNAMTRNTVQGCFFSASRTNNITVTGTMDSLLLCGNTATGGENSISGTVTTLTEKFNSWNT